MSTTRAVWIFIVALTAIRLSMLATTDLEFDEAHYWMWSERLAPAYFSKGPAIAFVIRASTAVFGANEFGVRLFSPLLAAGTSLLLFYFARRLFNATAGLWAVIALNVTPIFNIGAFLMTIDALSVFFWLAAMFTFWLAVEKSPNFFWYASTICCRPPVLTPPVATIMPMRSMTGLRPGAILGRKKINVVAAHTTTKNRRTRLTTYAALTSPPADRVLPRRCLQSAAPEKRGYVRCQDSRVRSSS